MTNPNPIRSLLSAGLLALLVSPFAVAGETALPKSVQSFVESHCIDCHEGEAAEAGLDLAALGSSLADQATFQRWVRIYDRVRNGEMPPEDSSDVEPEELHSFLGGAKNWLSDHQLQAWQHLGRVQGRRLTNLQLERTLQDLLGIDIPLASRMPEEQKASGFTTVANGQPMSHFQLQQHLNIVDLALDDAFERAIEGDRLFRKEFDAQEISRTNPKRRTREPEVIDNLAVTWSSRLIFYGRIPATTARYDGWYRFTIRAKGLKSPDEHGVWCTVRTGRCVSSAPLLNWIGAFEATDEIQEWTYDAWVSQGDMLEVRPGDDTLKMAKFQGGQVGTGEGEPQGVAGVGIESLVMERIHQGPDAEQIASILFGNLPIEQSGRNWRDAEIVSSNPKQDLERLLTRFAQRAFRKPVDQAEMIPFVEFAQQSIDEGKPFLEALRLGYRSLLCSPRFLYFNEQPGELDQFALASRLSYFLWNSMPDEKLIQLAEQGKLDSTAAIKRQVRRMLDDPKGEHFVGDLASQWLDLSEIDFTTPDRKLYPEFDVIVQQSMVQETKAYLQEMIDDDLSVTGLIDSDYTYLNERLARFYEIDGVAGDDLQRVHLQPKHHRGGLLTHGSVLKVTANGTTTSPVIRGVWISERLLGNEIPPPPTNVPAIEPDIRGAKTIRDMLEKHKSDPSCASCHRAIDPPGFALENFDPSGRWRDRYEKVDRNRATRGLPIDPSFELQSGEKFAGIEEFQHLITQHPQQLAANVAAKLVTYGTGAPITFADREDIDAITEQTAEQNYGFRSLIEAVAVNKLFRSK